MKSGAGLHIFIFWEHTRPQPKGCLAQAGALLYSGRCAPPGRLRHGGRKMPLSAFRFSFRKDADINRFGRLARLLERTREEIAKEAKEIRRSRDKMTDCAAFSFEAMENGEAAESMSGRIDVLTRNLASNRGRQASLVVQMAFIDRTQEGLARFLPSRGAYPFRH